MSGSNRQLEKKLKKYMETNENENTTIQTPWDAVKAVLRGKYIAIQAYLQETRKIPNAKSNSTPKGNRSRTAKTPQTQQKRRNSKDQSKKKKTI